jgi:ubiquinone/menaquinone biosynthesis C-methylase UbiE
MPVSGGTQFIKPQEVINKCQITQGMHVADLGCGNLGYFVLPIAKLVGKDGKVFAVDIQNPVLEGVRSRARLEGLSNVVTVRSNLEIVGSTKIPEKSLDLALLINVLFQNKNKENMLKEASRLLKPGAKLVVIDWKKISVPIGPHLELRVNPDEIKQMATKIKLNFQEEVDFGAYFWGMIFTKELSN